MRLLILFVALSSLLACSSIDSDKIKDFEDLPELTDQSYDISTLRVGDHLEIFVSGYRDSRQDVVVSDDGSFDLEHIGTIQANGKSRDAVRTEVAQKLEAKNFYREPQIVLNISRRENPPRVAVMGAVNRPGVVRFRANMNLAMALAEAGGLTELEGLARAVIVVRDALTTPTIFKFDIENAIVDAKRWPRLLPGDVIIAQQSLLFDVQRSIGLAQSATESITRPITTFKD